LLISPELLRDDGLLDDGDLAAAGLPEEGRVPWDEVAARREILLRTACDRWRGQGRSHEAGDFRARARWLGDYALFMALRRKYCDVSWLDWPADLRRRTPAASGRARSSPGSRPPRGLVGVDRQWVWHRRHAHEREVALMGDMPIFRPRQRGHVVEPAHLRSTPTAGPCPSPASLRMPSPPQQRWGNPLRLEALAGDGYGWWRDRTAWAPRR
jgi:4-alpha-glucanotransferase